MSFGNEFNFLARFYTNNEVCIVITEAILSNIHFYYSYRPLLPITIMLADPNTDEVIALITLVMEINETY